MWRPDDWDTNNEMRKAGQVSKQPFHMKWAFEAGANAMLKALFKLAEESPTKTFVIDSRVISVYSGEIEDG